MNKLHEFEKIIDYKFNNIQLLFEALSHSSFANESKDGLKSNERLDFWATPFCR